MNAPVHDAEASLRQAIECLMTPTAGAYRLAGEHLSAAVAALGESGGEAAGSRIAPGFGVALLVRQAAALLHNGAALRFGCGALAFPACAQYTASGSFRAPAVAGRSWEA